VNTIEEAIFHAASELQGARERTAFLERACGADPALRARIEALLEADSRARQFLADDPLGLGPDASPRPGQASAPPEETPGTIIGRYKLLQKIGEGGMGVVYMAEQQEPVRRRVALKIIKLGMDTKQVIARFEAERQALALMDHPNIAKVFDGGATEGGRPYFVMELVQGVPITEFCDRNQLTTEARVKLFIPVCQAIQSAHQKGIIHRDLKPTNILITLDAGVPIPKAIDFGVAKATNQRLTEKTLFTNYATLIGTPAYMSPEQAEMSSLDVDTRADIYGLGALLYELLTGTTPFPEKRLRSAGYNEMQRIILEEEPERPSTRLSTLRGEQRSVIARNRGASELTLGRILPGDLDWIVMKCLEKDRARRYETANGLAMDLQRHLHNEPVVARPPSAVYRLQKFVRRNKLAVAAAAAVAATLFFGVCASLWETARTKQAERYGQRLLYAADMRLAQAEWDQNHPGKVREILEQTSTYPDRGFEWYYWQQQTHAALKVLRGHLDEVWAAALSPDGTRIVTGSDDRTAIVWDAINGAPLITLKGHLEGIHAVAFSPDGQRIVTGSKDGQAMVWDATTGQPLLTLRGHTNQVCSAAFSRDGRRIVTCSGDRTAKVWDAFTGQYLLTLEGHRDLVFCAAFSPDGRWIVTGSADNTARVWDAASGNMLPLLVQHSDFVRGVAFSPDGKRIATACDDQTARVWEMTSGKRLARMSGHSDRVFGVAFSPDGRRIVTAGQDQTARVWDAESGKELFSLKGHDNWVTSAAFSPDGQRIVTGSVDRTARVWDAAGEGNPVTLRGHDLGVPGVAFSHDGKWMATGSVDQTAKVWETATGKLLQTLSGNSGAIHSVAFSPDGHRIVTGNGIVWEWPSGQQLFTLSGHSSSIIAVAFSPDGRRIATASTDRTAMIWDAATGKPLLTLKGHTEGLPAVAFSPDGQWVATGSGDGTARIWEAASGKPFLTLPGHTDAVYAVDFSPDSRRIATASKDGTARVWETTSGKELVPLRLTGHSDQVRCVAFSPDGHRIVTCSNDKTTKVWDAETGQELLTLKGHAAAVVGLAFSPDGQRVLTGGGAGDHTAKVWSVATPDQLARWQKEDKEASERVAARQREQFAADERERALVQRDPGAIRQWLILAPIRYEGGSGVAALAQEQIPEEAALRARAGQRVRVGQRDMSWRPVALEDYQLNLWSLLGPPPIWSVDYALCYLTSKGPQTNLCLRVGSDQQCLVYLNGKQIWRWEEPRVYLPDQDLVPGVELNEGLNVLVFKLAFQGKGEGSGFRGSIRFTDSAGQPVKGIRATITPSSAQDPGAIHDWLLLGPMRFDGTNGAGALAREQIPNEAHLCPRAGDRRRVGATKLVWREFHLDDYGLDFKELVAQTNADWCAAYAVCYVESEAELTNLSMWVGSDDQSKVYLNGQEVYRYDKPRPFTPDEDEVTGLTLRAGTNALVFKVVNEREGWRGSIRFADAVGRPVKGIRVTLAPPGNRDHETHERH